MERLRFSVYIVGAIAAVGFIIGGCARCPTAEKHPDLAAGICFPAGFKVMKGLADTDYDEGGWPRYIVCTKDGSIMALVGPRTYSIGSLKEPNEAPRHRVSVERFYIDLHEVNNVQYNRFSNQFACPLVPKDKPYLADEMLSNRTSRCWLVRNWKPLHAECLKVHPSHLPEYAHLDTGYFKEYWTPGVNDSHPARAVSYWEAWYYCRSLGKDLPTEAEWELAATGGDGRLYPWGNIEPDSQHLLCNYGGPLAGEDRYAYTAPVSSFGAGRSPVGCYNMAGNVWEWCKDNYDASIYAVTSFAKGAARGGELARQMTNPKGPAYGDARVLRGGAYTSDIYNCRASARESCRPNFHGMNIGFRGVLRIR